jgi:hypothetical protein
MTASGIAARAAAVMLFGFGCMALGARCAGSSGTAQRAVAQPPAVLRLSSDDRAELRRELAEEVRRAVASAIPASRAVSAASANGAAATVPADGAPAAAAASGAEAASAESMAAPTAKAVTAHETARRVVDDAVARGSWRLEDGEALRATLADLDPAAYSDVMGELVRAVNTGRLQLVARDRPMF